MPVQKKSGKLLNATRIIIRFDFYGGTLNIMIITEGNEIGELSSKPG